MDSVDYEAAEAWNSSLKQLDNFNFFGFGPWFFSVWDSASQVIAEPDLALITSKSIFVKMFLAFIPQSMTQKGSIISVCCQH